jgi:RimJ/RimL family protein N-acetyltransferase
MDVLRTERLILRRAQQDDLDAFHAILADPETMRYWSTPPHPDLETTQTWIDSVVARDASTSDDYVIELDGEVIGKAGCWQLPEFGFLLRRDLWGRGYITEASRAAIAAIFAAHSLDELIADVDPRNAASLRALGRLGFVETSRVERTWFIAGEWSDSVYLARRRGPGDPRPD